VLVALALDGASAEDAALLDRSLGQPLSVAEVERLRGIIVGSGAPEQIETVITELVSLAVAALDRARIDDRAREVLRELASAATQRVV
jgi:geranylgeranyl diphosphate synthase type I